MDVPHPRRVAVSMPVRSCHADSRLREHGVPGERSYPPRIRAASGSESVVIKMDEALCYSASTWWCAVGRSSRVLETPATTAMATPEGSRLAHTGLTTETGWSHGVVHAVSLH